MPLLRPIGGGGYDTRFNFDGFLSGSTSMRGNYVQLFRTGAIEAVELQLLDLPSWRKMTGFTGPDFISSHDLEDQLIKAVSTYTDIQQRLGIEPPVFVMVALLGVKGFRVTTSATMFGNDEIDRDALILPDVLMDNFGVDVRALLKPVFDAVAQAGGLPGSPSYDASGKGNT